MQVLWTSFHDNRAKLAPRGQSNLDGAVAPRNYWDKAFSGRGSNKACKELTLTVELIQIQPQTSKFIGVIETWHLLPESEAKPQPDYIPEAIRDAYYEACRIRDLSPMASATLSRRCLQGMIRDFHGIAKATLKLEIDALEKLVESPTWEAIDVVREVGNIGAHMEKDVNLIIDVEPEEAQLLIGLVETLFKDWYIAKHDRAVQMERLKQMAAEKDNQKNQQTTPSDSEPKEQNGDSSDG